MAKTKDTPQQLDAAAAAKATDWLQGPAAAAALPADVLAALQAACRFINAMAALGARHNALFKQLKKALGIEPSSEKGRSAAGSKGADEPPNAPSRRYLNPLERLRALIATCQRKMAWHAQCRKKMKQKSQQAQKRLDTLTAGVAADAAVDLDNLDDVELSEADLQECAADSAACDQRAACGGGADPALAPFGEALMQGGFAQQSSEALACKVDPQTLPRSAELTHKFAEEQQCSRLDFALCVRQLDIKVQKVVIKHRGMTQIVRADVEPYGPAKLQVTWDFLVNTALLVSQFAMPMHRLGKLLSISGRRISAAQLSRYYRFVAEHVAPVYLHLGRALANAPVLSGDDTPSLVLEVARALAAGSDKPLPWQTYATARQAAQTLARTTAPSLPLRLAAALGFAFPRKDGKGDKIGLNTSLLSGRAVAAEPMSTVVFYRTHLGSVGNLLDSLLPHRHAALRQVVLQTDLSTTNLISDTRLLKNLDIRLAGCMSHARRPFALYTQDEPILCKRILHEFKGIPILEHLLDAHGRNTQNTLAVRDIDARKCWELLRGHCEALRQKWSASTPLGAGARYVLRHYERLTYYLGDVRVSPSNNHSERLLREEKLVQHNSLFRATLGGRGALDIMRTLTQTAMAAKVDVAAYLRWVLRTPFETLSAEPESFTPYAFRSWEKTEPEATSPLPNTG